MEWETENKDEIADETWRLFRKFFIVAAVVIGVVYFLKNSGVEGVVL